MKTLNEIISVLKLAVEEVTLGRIANQQIQDQDQLLQHLKLDSLDYAAVMLAGEQFLGSKVNEDTINWRQIATVKDLAWVLYQCQ